MSLGIKKEEPIRLLIFGDREWEDEISIFVKLKGLKEKHGIFTVITGGCRGTDKMADHAAEVLGLDRITFPANWTGRCNSAGPYRNRKMFNEAKPNKAWAFHENISKSKGTKDMMEYCEQNNLKVELFTK